MTNHMHMVIEMTLFLFGLTVVIVLCVVCGVRLQEWLGGSNPCPVLEIKLDTALLHQVKARLRHTLNTQLQGPLQYLHAYSEE